MKKLSITILSVFCCGLMMCACNGTKKSEQSAENSVEATSNIVDEQPSGYAMPTASVNNYCGNFTDPRKQYGYLMPANGLFLMLNQIGKNYVITVYKYVMAGENIQCTPEAFVMANMKGENVSVEIKRDVKNNTPSFTFVPTPDCEHSEYVATEKVARDYFYLCGDSEARYKFEDLFEDERYAEFKNLVDSYKK
ncbi:hypothetical protein [Bacteroides sp.]|uniref:hypothetical protein n=1 Tax=Bacteroides sp. TaxID=29523 RepID=UPI002606361E|nr:hypothetical protein [Bacteroides sp.]